MPRYDFAAHPTKWNGIQYRSRLEARWAIFFTALGISFQYEPLLLVREGMRKLYVPDFYLPGLKCFLEVKPNAPTRKEVAKAQLLSTSCNAPVFISTNDFFSINSPVSLTFRKVQEGKLVRSSYAFDLCADCLSLDFLPREPDATDLLFTAEESHGLTGYKTDQLDDAFILASEYRFTKKESP